MFQMPKMPLRWRKRPQWPPSPSVEDEILSLSRELHGLSYVGELPGFEGVHARGSIDQCPVILDVLIVPHLSPDVGEMPTQRSRSPASDVSAGPPTPTTDLKQDPFCQFFGEPQIQEPLKKAPVRTSSFRTQDVPPPVQPPRSAYQMAAESRKSASSRQTPVALEPEPSTRKSGSPTRRLPAKPQPNLPQGFQGAPTPLKRHPSVSRSTRNAPAFAPVSAPQRPQYTVGPGTERFPPPPPSTHPSLAPGTHSAPLRAPTPPKHQQSMTPGTQNAFTSASTPALPRPQPKMTRRTESPSAPPLPPKHQTNITQRFSSTSALASAPAPGPPPAPIRTIRPEEVQHDPAPTMPKRSESVKPRRSSKRLVPDLHPTSGSGYQSDSAAVHRKQHRKPSDHPSVPQEGQRPPLSPGLLSPGPSVAERIEEKLRRRREQREYGPHQGVEQEDHDQLGKTGPVNSHEDRAAEVPGAFPEYVDPQLSVPPPAPAPQSTVPSVSNASGPASDGEVTSSDASKAKHPPQPKKSALRSISLDRAQPAPAPPSRRRTVSFAEKPLESPPASLELVKQETSLVQFQPPQQDTSPATSRSASPNTSFGLAPCPRTLPVAGYQDWHTIQGLDHLDICPSCIKQMRKSKFRDRFILSTPRPRTEKIRCSMSESWARLAWTQTLKKKLDHLDLLLQITRPPLGSKPCTGRIINDQHWYRVIDPDTDTFLPQFNACAACVRNIRILMPQHRDTFERSRGPQERVCDFVTDSPRFIRYIDALDYAATQAGEGTTSVDPIDLDDFLAYARRKVVLRDCRRSRLILNTWHYMPELPEFTVCEDCYDDVVWPLAKGRYPIAREFSTVMRVLPGDGPASACEASCKLYSPRIRAKFHEAVRRNDMPYLQWVALKRYEAEQRFRDRQEELLEDERRGYDCAVELRKNLEEWKRWE